MEITEIQEFLKLPADGKIGPKTLASMQAYLKEKHGVNASKWDKARILLGMEQAIYVKNKMEVGTVDGLIGEQTRYMRMLWEAKKADEEAGVDKKDPDSAVAAETNWKDKDFAEISKNDWPKQVNCIQFFGEPGTNQTKCNIPFPLVLAWDKNTKLTSFSCNKKVKKPIERVFQNTFDYYGYEKIKELGLDLFGGCLNVRKMRGGTSWSQHAFGIAIDIDPDRNSLHTTWKKAQMSKPDYANFVRFFYNEGAINLGRERDFDAMHFQFSRL